MSEAAKFDDRDSSATVDAALTAAGLAGGAGKPTMAIICLVACVMGDREEQVTKGDFQGEARKMKLKAPSVICCKRGWVTCSRKAS